jgi:hypothetical protein
MGRRFYKSQFYKPVVWLLAVAFLISGATWRQCSAAHAVPAQPGVHAAHDHGGSVGAAGHDHAAQTKSHHHAAAGDAEQQAPDDHACQKCCAMCGVASVMPAAPLVIIAPVVSAAFFPEIGGGIIDRAPLPDPGIPKRLS